MNCAAMRNGSISNWSGLSTIVWIILYKCTRIKISIDERNVLTAQKSTETILSAQIVPVVCLQVCLLQVTD